MEPAEILNKPYVRQVVPQPDGLFKAEILEFPGCFAVGDTAADALANLEEVAVDWIAATLAQGQDVPRPTEGAVYSGKFVLRMSRTLHRKAAQFALRDGVSLNQFIVNCVAEYVGMRARPRSQQRSTSRGEPIAMAMTERKAGHSRLVYNKATRTIDTVRTPTGPARDWYLAAEGASRAFEALRAAIESEGYEVLHDISDDTYLVRPRRRCATAGCAGHATQRYEQGCDGSLYCCGCMMKIVAVAWDTPMREALQFIASQEDLTFAECSVAEEIVRRAKAALEAPVAI